MTQPHLQKVLNLLLPPIQYLAIRSITKLLIDPSSESRGYDGQPQDGYGEHGTAHQGYSVSGSAGMPPGSAGRD